MGDSTADRSRDHRIAWLPLVVAAIVVPTVLAGLTLLWPRPQIEERLTATGGEALAAAGFGGAGLVLDGRDATITGVSPADGRRAIETVEGVTGVRIATAPEAGATADTPAEPADAEPFGVARRGDDLVLSGVVGSDDERARLLAAATAQAGGRNVVDELIVTEGAPLPSGVDPTSVGAVTAVLGGATGDTALSISDDGVTLTGTVADDAARDAAEKAVTAALPGADVDNQLVVDPSAGGGAAPATTELDAAAKQQLQSSISQLLAGAPLAFEPDSPTLTGPGSATLAKLLEILRPAPGARLEVDGFVAAGRGSGRLTAQELSDQRAATVRDALAAGGVPADHITARGLGEGTTPAEQAAGRRVEITVT